MSTHYAIFVGDHPLYWALDTETGSRVGWSTKCVHLFPTEEEAMRVMAEVGDLFQLDPIDIEALRIVDVDLPEPPCQEP